MKKIIKILKGSVFLLFVFLLTSSSQAITVNITTADIPVLDNGVSALTSISKIEVYQTDDTIDKPNSSGGVSNDLIIITDHLGNDITTDLVFNASGNVDFVGLANVSDDKIYVRIWKSSPGSGEDSYYVDKEYTIAGKQIEEIDIGGLRTNILNAMPPIPSMPLDDLSEKLARQASPSENYDLQISYSILPGTSTGAITDSYQVRVIKQAANGSWPSWPTTDHTYNFFSHDDGLTPTNDYYERGKRYRLQARSINHLGPNSDDEVGDRWSPVVEYESLFGETGITLDPVELIFYTNGDGKSGINFFSMPFPGPWYVYDKSDHPIEFSNYLGMTTNKIERAYDLVKAINQYAKTRPFSVNYNIVSSFGVWDPVDQQDEGILIYDNDPDNTASNPERQRSIADSLKGRLLYANEGYQVYLSSGDPTHRLEELTLVIKNYPMEGLSLQ